MIRTHHVVLIVATMAFVLGTIALFVFAPHQFCSGDVCRVR